ncbi:MAG: hypothetical protein JWP89_4855 [Schlesneria sp.]|nr:hypothetical protein [Schlesneria sp.]
MQQFLMRKLAIPGWVVVSAALCVVIGAMLSRRFGAPISKPNSIGMPTLAATHDMEVAKSPFRCTANEFEAAMTELGMPFKGDGNRDAKLLFRGSRMRKVAGGFEHLWLSRENGAIRSVVYWRGADLVVPEPESASQGALECFRSIAKLLMKEEDAHPTIGWFILARDSATTFELKRRAIIDELKDRSFVGETDLVYRGAGLKISHRRVATPENGLVMHVVNFDIDRQSPDWPEPPFKTE